jgi:hypothetical protein
VYEDPKYDSRWLSLGKETIMEVDPALFKSLYQEKKKNPTKENQQSREKGMDSYKWS